MAYHEKMDEDKSSSTQKQPKHMGSQAEPTPLMKSGASMCPAHGQNNSGRNAEWDECIKEAMLTIGSGMVTAIAAGMIVPPADVLLLVGTGVGVLWSVKRCRTLMRDGLLSPEEAKLLSARKKEERAEAKRLLRLDKAKREEKKLKEKQKKRAEAQNISKTNECCTKLKKILEEKGISVDGSECDRLKPTDKQPAKVQGRAVPLERKLKTSHESVHTVNEDQRNCLQGTVDVIDYKGEHELADKPQEVKVHTLTSANGRRPTEHHRRHSQVEMFSSVKLFAPHTHYLSASVKTCNIKDCACKINQNDLECTCDHLPTQISHQEPQLFTLATDAEEEDVPPGKEGTGSDQLYQNNHAKESEEQNEEKTENQQSQRKVPELDSAETVPSAKSTTIELGQPLDDKKEFIIEDPEEGEEEVEIILSDGGIIEIILEESEDTDYKIENSEEQFSLEIVRNDDSFEPDNQPVDDEEVTFGEAHRSESWPFSFSLPSLENFSKKKNSSFKWPPLTSSIIVKPKKDPPCTCSHDPDTSSRKEKTGTKGCKCGKSTEECSCS